jgi:hypothetical protein
VLNSLQICREILEGARDAGDEVVEAAAHRCLLAFKFNSKPKAGDWALVKEIWVDRQSEPTQDTKLTELAASAQRGPG